MLREKQIAFCKEYVRCKNPELAALNAGYNPHYGKVLLSRREIADFCNRQEISLIPPCTYDIGDGGKNEGEMAGFAEKEKGAGEEISLFRKEKTEGEKEEKGKTNSHAEKESKDSTPAKTSQNQPPAEIKDSAPAQTAQNQSLTEIKEQSPQPPPPNSPQNNNGIATPEDVLRFLTDIMNGEEAMRDKLRAAELLGKRYGLFKETADEEENKCLVIVGEDKL